MRIFQMQLRFKFKDIDGWIISDITKERIEDINKVIWILLYTLKAEEVHLIRTEEDLKGGKN